MAGLGEEPETALEIAALPARPATAPARFPLAWLWSAAHLSRREQLFWASFACLLCAHSIFSGLIIDDFLVLHQVGNASLLWGLVHAFHLTGDAPSIAQGLELGYWPWWTPEGASFHFFRPLAALTHALDVRLFHDAVWLMHLENLFVLFLLTLAALRWFQLLLPDDPQVARVAGVLYALAPGHAANASWLSGRNACLAALFAILALLAHHRARESGRRALLALSALCLALSLLSAEMGTATLALLFAHACFLDRAPWKQRLLWLTPALLTAGCWLAIYASGHYGARESPAYTNALHDPLGYLAVASVRLPVMLLGSFGWPVIAFNALASSSAQLALALLGLVFMAALAPRLLRALRSDARARFCALAFCLSVLPVLSTFPHDRLLMISDLGAFPLLAFALLRAHRSDAELRFGRGLLLSRVALSLPLALTHSGAVWELAKSQRWPFEVALPAQEMRDKSIIFINAPCVTFARYLFHQREYEGQPAPRNIRNLAQGIYGLSVRRLDAQVLSLRAQAGLLQPLGSIRTDDGRTAPPVSKAYLAQLLNQVSLPDPRVPLGTRIRLSDVTLTVVETTPEGWPRELRAEFRAPLEDAQFAFVQWKDDGWHPWPVPRVGETVRLPPILE